MESIVEFLKYRTLLWVFIKRNIMMKYKQTVMGFLWAIFMPMIIVLSGVIVKIAMAKISGGEVELTQIVSVSVKALPWAFFIGALKFSVGSLVTNMNILGKIYFPRVIFPLSYIFGQLFDFCIAAVVFIVLLTFAKIGVSIYLLWLPVFILFLVLFTAGLGMMLSCGNLFYRDVKYIVDVVLTFAIFFTPVFYSADLFGTWGTLLLLNPVGAILECINSVIVLHQPPSMIWMGYSAFWAFFSFWIGWVIFHKAEPLFAESI
ncbi:hypothetical protein MNBD_UNCLBAC01-1095 [hydrothermal vent metagenome]|uniref:ABC-2 type transporter transmembrane domain-containing protein n=1 Tax=hydrothermal vent metagenome TaxID=652676 RepID=A0A3B1DDD0_9ZZZZ